MSDKYVSVDDRLSCSRMCEARKIPFDWNSVASEQEKKFIQNYSSAIGCPDEFFYFPYLSCASAMLGRSTRMIVNSSWEEPAILWNVVAARKGEKKTAAANLRPSSTSSK